MLIVTHFLEEQKMVSLHNGELFHDTFLMPKGYRMPL